LGQELCFPECFPIRGHHRHVERLPSSNHGSGSALLDWSDSPYLNQKCDGKHRREGLKRPDPAEVTTDLPAGVFQQDFTDTRLGLFTETILVLFHVRIEPMEIVENFLFLLKTV